MAAPILSIMMNNLKRLNNFRTSYGPRLNAWLNHRRHPVICSYCDLIDTRSETSVKNYSTTCDVDLNHESLSHSHVSVLTDRVVEILLQNGGRRFLDMTFGNGGHTEALLRQRDDVIVYGLDRDPVTLKAAHRLRQEFDSRFVYLEGKFSDLQSLLSKYKLSESYFDGALFDLGASSMQFDSAIRGFSLSKDGPLDMRMDWSKNKDQVTAADVVNKLNEEDLYSIIKRYGEDSKARKIARTIVDARYTYGKITSTKQLADIIAEEVEERRDRLNRHAHPATKTFQALRIFVNNELNELNNGLQLVHRYLKPGGICATISFHSLEDRIIKQCFHGKYDTENFHPSPSHRSPGAFTDYDELQKLRTIKWVPVTKKVIEADEEEIRRNPRSRSAKLRAAFKVESS